MEASPSRSTPMVGNVWTAQPVRSKTSEAPIRSLAPGEACWRMSDIPLKNFAYGGRVPKGILPYSYVPRIARKRTPWFSCV